MVARLGGDEFAVLLPNASADAAEVVAAKIVRLVHDRVSHPPAGHDCHVTASIGVALFDDPTRTGEDVLMDADRSMYLAKQCGHDRFAILPSPEGLVIANPR